MSLLDTLTLLLDAATSWDRAAQPPPADAVVAAGKRLQELDTVALTEDPPPLSLDDAETARLLAGVLHESSACLDACDAAPNALAWARVRVAALGAVTLLASSEANCAALLSSEPEGIASACVACLRSEAAKHDPLASRTAVTIVRNLALAPANRARLGRVPKLLEVLVSQAVSSRDPNAAGAAAAPLRMLVDGCAHNAVVRALPYR